jgi:hypothetical protein
MTWVSELIEAAGGVDIFADRIGHPFTLNPVPEHLFLFDN